MTQQASEIIFYGRNQNYLSELPVEPFLAGSDSQFRHLAAANGTRGYLGTWAIQNDRLYLLKLVDLSGGNLLPEVFPTEPAPIVARWYTGDLTFAKRKGAEGDTRATVVGGQVVSVVALHGAPPVVKANGGAHAQEVKPLPRQQPVPKVENNAKEAQPPERNALPAAGGEKRTPEAAGETGVNLSELRAPDCVPLIEAAHLNLYRENLFRITGLPVDATAREVARHADRLKMLEELGRGAEANGAAFALDPPPSLDQIREALQRLKDPERRLIDEFFWFWPESFGSSKEDPAIQALQRGDMPAAFEIWGAKEADPESGHIAIHNMAVLYHIIALDWTAYHLAADVDSEREAKIVNAWKQSFSRWEKVATDDRVWKLVEARIRAVDDARLSVDFARRLSGALPLALDKINAEVALRFAEERGRIDLARMHVAFMLETNQGLDDVERTSELVLRPIRNRVKERIRQAKEAAGKEPESGADAAEDLLAYSLPLHELYEVFHGESGHQKTELFDEVVLACVDCVVSYHKSTGDDVRFVELLHAAMPIATGMDVRQRVRRNIDAAEENARGKVLEPLYERLKILQESKERARKRLHDFNLLLMPELAELVQREGADSALVEELSDAMAIVLRGLSLDAHNTERDFQTAVEAGGIALRLAASGELRQRLQEDVAVLEKNFDEFKAALVDLKIRSDRVALDSQRVRYNKWELDLRDVRAVRFGILINYRNGIKTSSSYRIGFLGNKGQINIECSRFMRSEETTRADYSSILGGIYYYIVPALAASVAQRVAAGVPESMGAITIMKDGVNLQVGSFLWARERFVPWSDVRFRMDEGMLNVFADSNSKVCASVSLRDTWNAVIFDPVAKILANPQNK